MEINFIKKVFCKSNIVIEFILSLILSASILDFLYQKTYKNLINGFDIFFIIISVIAIISIIVYNIIKNKKRLEIYFLIFMIPIGMMYYMFLMPNYAPDELEHIEKAYDISLGHIVTPIDENGESRIPVPSTLATDFDAPHDSYTDLENAATTETDYTKEARIYSAAQAYSPVLYIFSGFGFFLGRLFNLNIVFTVYLARLFNYIFFLVCGYFAIKLIPFGKLIVFTYLFNSMFIHQAISISADSVTNTVAILYIAYTLYLLFEKKTLDIKNKFIYLLLAISLAISKNVYFPIVALAFVLLGKNTLTEKKDKAFVLVTVVIGVISAVLWYLFGTTYKDVYIDVMNFGYNPSEQLKYVLSAPFNFVIIMIRTMINTTYDFVCTFIGTNMGWLNISPGFSLHLMIYLVLLILSPFVEDNKKSLHILHRIWFLLVTIGVTMLMLLGFYLNASGVGSPEVESMQGRYFIPIAILPLLCLVFKGKNLKIRNVELMYAVMLCAINGIQILAILSFLLRIV